MASNPRWLGEEDEPAAQRRPVASREELAAQIAVCAQTLDVFGEPGWAHIAAQATAAREMHLHALASPAAAPDMDSVSRYRGRIAVYVWLLGLPDATAKLLRQLEDDLAVSEADNEEA